LNLHGLIVFIIATLLQILAVAGLLVFFKPLLLGIMKAIVLLVNPRLTKEQKLARRNMRDAKLLQRMIKETDSPEMAAELRALGCRS
jgi:hypothetical protein